MSKYCDLATKKSNSWIPLVVVGGSLLLFIMVLAIIGLAFGVMEVAIFLLTIHYNGTLYIIVIAGVVMIVMALMKKETKRSICNLD